MEWHSQAFELLNRLELPDKIDCLGLTLRRCSPVDLSKTLGPYFGDHIRRRGRFSDGGLGISANRNSNNFRISVGAASGEGDSAKVVWFVVVSIDMGMRLGDEVEGVDGFCLDLMKHIPREEIISFQTPLPILRSEELCVRMCNLTHLHISEADLSTWFTEPDVRGPYAFKDLLRGLRHITITQLTLSGDWGPFTNFLSRRAAVGNPISSLQLGVHPHIDEDVVEIIKRVVEDFEDDGICEGHD